jgi:hypothetical protein
MMAFPQQVSASPPTLTAQATRVEMRTVPPNTAKDDGSWSAPKDGLSVRSTGRGTYEVKDLKTKKTLLVRAESAAAALGQAKTLIKNKGAAAQATPQRKSTDPKTVTQPATVSTWSETKTTAGAGDIKPTDPTRFGGSSRQQPAPSPQTSVRTPSVNAATWQQPKLTPSNAGATLPTRNTNPLILGNSESLKPIDVTAGLRKGQLPLLTGSASRTESKLTIDGEQVVVMRSRDPSQPVKALLLSSGQLLSFNAGTTDKGIENSRIVRDQLARIKDRPTEAVDPATGKTVQKAFVYALTGAVTSYNILRSQNYSKQEALALLPAGGLRDVI